MKITAIFLILIIPIWLIHAQTPGKRLTRYGFEVYDKPLIYYDTYFTYSPESSKQVLNFVIKIQNDLLQFTKVNGSYKAGYEVAFALKDSKNQNTVFTQIWNSTVIVMQFEQTNSKSIYQVDYKSFDLDTNPGEYDLILDVTDTGSDKVYKSDRKVIVPNKGDEVTNHTEIMLLNKTDSLLAEIVTGDEIPIVEFDQDLIAFFEFELPSQDSIMVHSELQNLENGQKLVVQKKEYNIYSDRRYYRFYEVLSKSLLEEGYKNLIYNIIIPGSSIKLEKGFNVVWYKKPIYLYETELAIRPMKYLLEASEWDEIDDMPFEQQRTWFIKFWKNQDPTPETPLNEIQYEFYFRVDLANRDFSLRFKEGWETDRGYALILYGEPNKRDLHRYVTHTKPYEIWYYEELNKRLTFIDVDKDGDYKLLAIEDLEETENE